MKAKSYIGKIVIGALLALVAVVFVTKTWFINIYRIPHGGMYPTIKSGGLVFSKLKPYNKISDVKRGDIILFKQAEDEAVNVWRVVALPGDAIQILGETVKVNGQALERKELKQEGGRTIYRESNSGVSYEIVLDPQAKADQPPARTTIAEDSLFVLGDNRAEAHDSRYFGPVKFQWVMGKKL